MKTYTFFYYDSLENSKNAEFKSYVVTSPRFDSAYKSFSHFLSFSEADYIDFVYTYNVFNGFRTQVRSFSYNDILHLVHIKDKHNAKFWETYHGN